MADREQIFFRRLIAAMAPSGTYGYNSGGEPLDIPSLTYEELKKFHADHYNPANSQILTFGDLDIPKTGAQIEEALNSVPAGHVSPSIEPEPRWTEPKHVTFACPWNESASDPEKQSTASVFPSNEGAKIQTTRPVRTSRNPNPRYVSAITM